MREVLTAIGSSFLQPPTPTFTVPVDPDNILSELIDSPGLNQCSVASVATPKQIDGQSAQLEDIQLSIIRVEDSPTTYVAVQPP